LILKHKQQVDLVMDVDVALTHPPLALKGKQPEVHLVIVVDVDEDLGPRHNNSKCWLLPALAAVENL
jgi:hypothetical protein